MPPLPAACTIYLAIMVFVIAGGWKMLSKGGLLGVAIIVPVWNAIALAQLAQKPWWWGLLTLIPLVGIIFAVLIMHGISTAFGRGVGTTHDRPRSALPDLLLHPRVRLGRVPGQGDRVRVSSERGR